jgi:hypothetical protein
MNMEIKPVEINIKNNYLFSQLVRLIDRNDFLADIESIRKEKLKLHDLYDRGLIEELYKYHYGFSLGLVTKRGFQTAIKSLSKKYKNASTLPLSVEVPMSVATTEAGRLLHKYHRNSGYLMAVVYSILCGAVNDGDYSTNTFPLIINSETIKSPLFKPPFSYVTIAINPESTPDEVLSVFKKTYSAYFHEKVFPKAFKKERFRVANDTMSKIKDFRKWYWMNHKNNPDRMGYRKLESMTKISIETIKSGIKSYSSLVSASK